jgi:protoporphyrinogen oxidase
MRCVSASAPAAAQAATKTSLIEHFLYPRLGPGQLWQEVARRVIEGGGEIRHGQTVQGLRHERRVCHGRSHGGCRPERRPSFAPTMSISTMPVKDLVAGMQPAAPADVKAIAGRIALPRFHDRRPAGFAHARQPAVAQRPC